MMAEVLSVDDARERYRRFLQGDKEALAGLVRDYHKGLTLYLNGILGNICDAEDMAQETFARIMLKRPVMQENVSFKTWLYSIGKHAAIDMLRHRTLLTFEYLGDNVAVSDENILEKDYLVEEEKINLYRALKEIKKEYMQVLYLMFFEELSVEEIACIMGKNRKAVYNLVANAKAALRKKLTEQEG